MKLIVDTNIAFSALLNTTSTIGEILLNLQDDLEFYAPELLREELERYEYKLLKASKLNKEQLKEATLRLLPRLTLVSEDLICENSWKKAFDLTKDIDEDDTPFVALSIELNAKLWTGDKKLATGLSIKGSEIIITTSQLTNFLKEKFN